MPAKKATTESEGFTAEERAAMKERAAELRAEGKKGAKAADGLQAVLDGIAKMAPQDRALAERVHVTVTSTAPELSPKTWYGMPAYANADGKVVVFFQDSGKFNYRYSTLGFQDAANLDDGFINGVRDQVTPGTSALFLMSSDAVMDKVKDAFDGQHVELIQTNLDDAQEAKLREVFAE